MVNYIFHNDGVSNFEKLLKSAIISSSYKLNIVFDKMIIIASSIAYLDPYLFHLISLFFNFDNLVFLYAYFPNDNNWYSNDVIFLIKYQINAFIIINWLIFINCIFSGWYCGRCWKKYNSLRNFLANIWGEIPPYLSKSAHKKVLST